MAFIPPRRGGARPLRSCLSLLPLLALGLPLAGCDYLGIESAGAVAVRKEAEGKAIGAGCRHAARSIEQCYLNNRRADKAAVFAGWKEMNDYMRENSIEAVPPPPEPVVADAGAAASETDAEPAASDKAHDKAHDKARDGDKPVDKPASKGAVSRKAEASEPARPARPSNPGARSDDAPAAQAAAR